MKFHSLLYTQGLPVCYFSIGSSWYKSYSDDVVVGEAAVHVLGNSRVQSLLGDRQSLTT